MHGARRAPAEVTRSAILLIEVGLLVGEVMERFEVEMLGLEQP